MSNVDIAHSYAAQGWRVIPLHHIADGKCSCRNVSCPQKSWGKHPLESSWQKTASRSGADIQAWWDENPDANIGIATGAESGIFVLDVDGDDGANSMSDFFNEHGPFAPTRVVRTGSGGTHYYFTWPDDFTIYNSSQWLSPGIDIRGKSGQVVAPPSQSGRGAYSELIELPPSPAPEWLLIRLREHSLNYERGRTIDVKSGEPFDMSFLPEKVRELTNTIIGEDEGRFRHFYAIIAACREAGLTQGQTVTIITPWCQRVKKFSGRVASEVARSWGKLDAAQERVDEWIGAPTSGTSALAPIAHPAPAATATADESEEGDNSESAPVDVPSWSPIDLTEILSGTYEPEHPALMPRDDGPCLIYPHRVHSFHGESESGKSLIAQAECSRVLADPSAGRVLYLDFESDQGAVIDRVLRMGAPKNAIRDRLDYVRPETNPYGLPFEREAFAGILHNTYSLAILDGVTEALVTYGAGSLDNDEITGWMRRIPRLIAQRTGAAVVLVDHVVKSSDSRGRFAIGGQAKMAALDGAAYSVEVVEPLGQGMIGKVSIRVAKDRPGAVRPQSGAFRKGDRTQEAAIVVVNSKDDPERIQVAITAPDLIDPAQWAEREQDKRRREIYDFISSCTEPPSQKVIEASIRGRAETIREDVTWLVEHAHVNRTQAAGRGGGYRFQVGSRPLKAAENGTSSNLVPTSSANRDEVASEPRPSSPVFSGDEDAVSNGRRDTPCVDENTGTRFDPRTGEVIA